jgi:hypothetical protein
MENNQEVTAQGGKIGHRSGKSNRDPLRPVNIGGSKIFWNACQGVPWDVDPDAGYGGNVSFYDHNAGLILTPNNPNQYGEVYWNKGYDITKDIYLKGTFLAGLGTGGNNCGMYFFDVFVYFNELDNSIYVQTQANAFTSDNYFSGDILGDTTWRTFEVIYEYKKSDVRYVTVLMNGKHICRVDVGAAVVPNNPYVGVFARAGSLTNIHYCKSFEVRSAIPWFSINVPKITNKNDKIFILINDTYVDYLVGESFSSNEPNNIIAYLDANTIDYETFTDISESGWEDVFILGKAGYVIIPELEINDILPDLTSGAKNKINNFVSSGGNLLMFCPGNGDAVPFLNDVFSFSITGGEGGASVPISLTVDGSVLFPSESATIPNLSDTNSLDTTSLPVNSVTIYEGNGADESVVTMIPYGSGKIYVLGWDWYDAAPIGPEDGGWLHLLESILQS